VRARARYRLRTGQEHGSDAGGGDDIASDVDAPACGNATATVKRPVDIIRVIDNSDRWTRRRVSRTT
jgi:hypothetical protein